MKYSWSHSSEVRDGPSYVSISCRLRSRFELCNGVIVPNLLVFQLQKPKEMFICIFKELNQLYKLCDVDMIYWQLLVNPTKSMLFMSKVDNWMQSVSGIFSMYFAIFCYFPHLLTAFSNFEYTRSNFLTEETTALHWVVGVFPATSRENPVWTACRYKTDNNIQRLENWLKSVLRLFLKASFPWKSSGSIE